MKYSAPKINSSLLLRAKEYFNAGITDYKERLLKKDSDLIESCFGILRKFFSTIGRPNLTTRMMIKEEPPRTSPSSAKYNEFVDAVNLDLHGAFRDQNELDRAVSLHYNYSQANRNMFDSLLTDVDNRIRDFAIISKSVDTKDVWYKDSFNSEEYVELNDDAYMLPRGYLNTTAGIFTLHYNESDDILLPENIDTIDALVDTSSIDNIAPYYGKRYGVVDNLGFAMASDEGIRPDTNDPNNAWDFRSIYNLVDPAGADTYWEVEATLREDWIGKDSGGPIFFITDAGHNANGLKSDGYKPMEYSYDDGYLYYNSMAYPTNYLYKNRGLISRKLVVALRISLTEVRKMDMISITRHPIGKKNVDGTTHDIIVESIFTSADGIKYEAIPQFLETTNYRSSESSTTTSTDTMHSPVGVEVGTRGVRRASNTSAGTTQTPAKDTIGTRVVGTTELSDKANLPSKAIIMQAASSNYRKADSWVFPTREVKYIVITLSTNKPYKIKYSMDRHKVTTSPSRFNEYLGGAKDKVQWIFMQRAGARLKDIKSGDSPEEDQSWYNMVKMLILGPGGSAIWNTLSNLWANKEPEIDPIAESHTIDNSDDSDMYRWSIELSDISANGANYLPQSELLSRSYTCQFEIDRIMLYTNDEYNEGNIEYYIIPEGMAPYRIQPWEDNDTKFASGRYVPKILYVNSDMTQERRNMSRWGPAAYIDTTTPLHKFRLRAVLTRGDNVESTPKIKDYKIRIIPKSIGGIVKHVE